MSRFSYYDTDEERLPEGLVRVGYDADTQVYTYRDSDGSFWEGAPGSQYGQLTRVGGPVPSPGPASGPLLAEPHLSWRQENQPLLNFFLIIGLFLIGVFWFMGYATRGPTSSPQLHHCATGDVPYTIQKGDTCWGIANEKGLQVEDLLRSTNGLNCDSLGIGQVICLPLSPS